MNNWKSKILRFGKYTWSQIDYLVSVEGYIPVATAEEFRNLKISDTQTMGVGSRWEGSYTTGLDKKYVQVNNIDFEAYIDGVGNKLSPIGGSTPFTGVYDGNNLRLDNIYMFYAWDNNAVFGAIENATLKNILIRNAYVYQTTKNRQNAVVFTTATNCEIYNIVVVDSTTGGYYYSSGLGVESYDSLIYNIQVINIELYPNITSAKHSGGLLAHSIDSVVESSYCTGKLIFPDSTYRYYRTGGFIGRNFAGSTIQNCWCKMYIEASGMTDVGVGGFVGQNYGIIDNCCAMSFILRKPGYTVPIGGLVGKNESGGIVLNSYYDSDVSGLSDTGKGLPRTTAQMLNGTASSYIKPDGSIDDDENPDNAMFTTWDDDTWNFRTNLKYPKIRKI